MSIDLNRLVSQYLTPQLVGQIASTAGVDPDAAQKLVSGATPAVLASLAAAPGGAQKLADAVSNADPDLLAKLTSALGAGQLPLLDEGAKALGGLIGADRLTALANALGQHADIPPEAAQSALGAIGQAVIGVIGQQDPSTWSDAGAIATLLAGQRNAVAAALPPALSTVLGSSGGLAGVTPAAPRATAAAPPASSPTGQARPASGGLGLPIWAIVLVVIVVLVAIYWFMNRQKPEKPAASLAPATIELALRDGASSGFPVV
jgi:hypothetical protein